MNFKAILYFLIITSVISCSKKEISDLEKFNLNGKVHIISYSQYEATEKFGEAVKGKLITDSLFVIKFDPDGKIIDSTWQNGKFSKTISYNGNRRSEVSYYENLILIGREKLKYDKNNELISIDFINDKNALKGRRIYTKDKNITTVNTYNSDGKLQSREKNIYNESGKLIKINTVNSSCLFKYSEDNKLKEKTFTQNNQIIEDCTDYDRNFFQAKLKYEQTITKVSKYNNIGDISSYNFKVFNNLASVVEDCNSYGWSDGYSESTTYKYSNPDKKNNWTNKIVKTKYGTTLLNRKISYYIE